MLMGSHRLYGSYNSRSEAAQPRRVPEADLQCIQCDNICTDYVRCKRNNYSAQNVYAVPAGRTSFIPITELFPAQC